MDPTPRTYRSAFDRIHDAVVLGGGHAGLAAVLRLRAQGVAALWLEPRAALLADAGWTCEDQAGVCNDPLWRGWQERLAAKGGVAQGRLDGAIAEVEVAAMVRDEELDALFYAWPVAAERSGGLLAAVIVATKSGLRRIAARRWIDASDEGLLARFCGAPAVPAPATRRAVAVLRRHAWDGLPEALGAGARLEAGQWPEDRRLVVELGAGERLWSGLVRGLTAVRALGVAVDGAVVTHTSCIPASTWRAGATPAGLPANLALAVPGWSAKAVTTLADRFALGLVAAAKAVMAPAAEADLTAPLPSADSIAAPGIPAAEVGVIGLGTGGIFAALAAAGSGARIVAVEPLPFAGGIASGGGIHYYYHGMKGGMQDKLDQRIRQLMPLFGAACQVQGFHPDARKAALDGLVTEAGIEPLCGVLADVRRTGRRITGALVATAEGPRRIAAAAWIDGSGDGDLCALAGARFRFGREGDGLPHGFSQSSGRVGLEKGRVKMEVMNFDQGFTDPADAEDLTLARLLGVAQYRQARYAGSERPTYIAPALGLRQGRHVVCLGELSLDDLIARRRFPDAVGLTGCHYDNHAGDYEWESAEGRFWVWACRQWHGRTACDIPYRILVPADLDNCWIASRCLGVSQDAHHSLRMQRDMQRIGEVAGLAAVQALRAGCTAAAVPYPPLRAALQASGALTMRKDDDGFGPETDPAWFTPPATDLLALSSADWAIAGPAMWRLLRDGSQIAELRELAAGADATVSWRAACVLAQRGDGVALPRLWQALATREYGIDGAHPWHRIVPDWVLALPLLGACAGPDALPALERALLGQPLHSMLASLLAGAIEAIAGRGRLDAAQTEAAKRLLDRCVGATAGAWRNPQQGPAEIAGLPSAPSATARAGVLVDSRWQLRLAVARARTSLGLAVKADAGDLNDERALVRRAVAAIAPRAAVGSAA